MSGRPPSNATPALRVEVLKELQQLVESREARDRVDRGPLAETKGREHWVLHLLLRADESLQSHVDVLVGTAYANLLARLQATEDRLERLEDAARAERGDIREQLGVLSKTLDERVDASFDRGLGRIDEGLRQRLHEDLTERWKPIGESIETFAQGSRQILKDVSDTYRVATQTRLLLNENARRITDLGRDLVALEESLKLVVAKTIEEAIVPLEQRLQSVEAHAGLVPANGRPPAERTDDPEPGA
ncbi:MAG TPA: hypothetical protein VMH78_07375 [Thermoplasmata archaeon]|nr:hypothetical protein [Thermoplasmata archaeon]